MPLGRDTCSPTTGGLPPTVNPMTTQAARVTESRRHCPRQGMLVPRTRLRSRQFALRHQACTWRRRVTQRTTRRFGTGTTSSATASRPGGFGRFGASRIRNPARCRKIDASPPSCRAVAAARTAQHSPTGTRAQTPIARVAAAARGNPGPVDGHRRSTGKAPSNCFAET